MQLWHSPFFVDTENVPMPRRTTRGDGIVDRTFVVAHLLTGRADLAESASLEAINAWKPEIENGEAIIRHVVAAALRKGGRRDVRGLNKTKDDVSHSYLPAELQAVLELRRAFRQSFLLRLLAGFSQEECAGLMGSSTERIDRAARKAARLIAIGPHEFRRRNYGASAG
jgi:hypothetical protein